MLTAKEDTLLVLHRNLRDYEKYAEHVAASVPEGDPIWSRLAFHSGARSTYLKIAIEAVRAAVDVDLDNDPVS